MGTMPRISCSLVSVLWLLACLCFVSNAATHVSEASPSKKSSLLFQGDVTARSEVLPVDVTASQLTEFMRLPGSMKAFASGGDAENQPEEVPLNADWEAAWKKYSTQWYGGSMYMPEQGDTIFASKTWTKLPGLKLCTTVYTGVKVLQDERNLPCFCFLVIGQKQTAKGLPAVVWLFHQIMGTKMKPAEEESVDSLVPSGPVKSVYCVEKSNQDGRLCFRLDTNFQMRMEFPSLLLRLMPMSRKKAEKQGSDAVSKTISSASQKGIESGYQAFQRFYEQRKR